MTKSSFEWDDAKDGANRLKHGLSFAEAQYAFADPNRVIARDLTHGSGEEDINYIYNDNRNNDEEAKNKKEKLKMIEMEEDR